MSNRSVFWIVFVGVLVIIVSACTPLPADETPTPAPVGFGATIAAADVAIHAASTAQYIIAQATADSLATSQSLSVQATAQSLSIQATEQALHLADLQYQATAAVELRATEQAIGVFATQQALEIAAIHAQATATQQAHQVRLADMRAEKWQVGQMIILWGAALVTVLLLGGIAIEIYSYVRSALARRLARPEIERVGNTYVLIANDGTVQSMRQLMQLGAPGVQPLTPLPEQPRVVVVNGEEQIWEPGVDLGQFEQQILALVDAGIRCAANGPDSNKLPGWRVLKWPPNDWHTLTEHLRDAGLLEKRSGAGGGTFLRPDCPYPTLGQLATAIRTGELTFAPA